ncbi:Ca2+-binding RTX toxin-like protein, partial [Limnobacter thiooxidans]
MATINKSTETKKQTIVGAGEDDLITGSAFADTIRGNGGNDTIDGGTGNDLIYGGSGNDQVMGGGGNDLIYGESGNDTLDGGTGSNKIYGGAGSDSISAGDGHDLFDGGDGDDLVDYSKATSGIKVNTGLSGPQAVGGRQGSDTLVSIEQVRGSMFNDIIEINGVEGSGAVHFASGGNGDDQITINANVNIGQADGGLGDDTILITGVRGGVVNAGEGNDTIQIQAVNERAGSGVIVVGEEGDDFISVEGGFDHSVRAGEGDDVIYVDNAVQRELDGGAGDDMLVIQGSAELGTIEEPVAPAQFIQNIKGMETIVVLGAQDTIIDLTNTDSLPPGDFIPFVDMTDNTIIGGDGRDDIRAGAGDDVLIGGLGDDTLNGGTGDDVLIAGEGDDTLVGGEGQDTLILSGNVIDYVVKLRAVEATQSIANPAYAIALAEVTEAKQAFYVQFNMLNNKYGVNDGGLIIPSGIPGDDAEALQAAAFENSQNPNVNGLYDSSDFEPGSELSNLFLAFDFAEGTLEDTPSLIESQVVVDHEFVLSAGQITTVAAQNDGEEIFGQAGDQLAPSGLQSDIEVFSFATGDVLATPDTPEVALAMGSDTGESSLDGLSNDRTPTLKVTFGEFARFVGDTVVVVIRQEQETTPATDTEPAITEFVVIRTIEHVLTADDVEAGFVNVDLNLLAEESGDWIVCTPTTPEMMPVAADGEYKFSTRIETVLNTISQEKDTDYTLDTVAPVIQSAATATPDENTTELYDVETDEEAAGMDGFVKYNLVSGPILIEPDAQVVDAAQQELNQAKSKLTAFVDIEYAGTFPMGTATTEDEKIAELVEFYESHLQFEEIAADAETFQDLIEAVDAAQTAFDNASAPVELVNDFDLLQIDEATGEVTLASEDKDGKPLELDHESKPIYTFQVRAVDEAGNASFQTVTVNVTDLDESAPLFVSATTATVVENTEAGITVYTAKADDDTIPAMEPEIMPLGMLPMDEEPTMETLDPDTDNLGEVTYSLKVFEEGDMMADDSALFVINETTGEVSFAAGTTPPNFESLKKQYKFTVVATDAADNMSEQQVTLNVADIGEDNVKDMFVGTAEDDFFNGLSDDDTLEGLAGDDILIGGAGNDTITAGEGDDVTALDVSTDGSDSINMGAGRDTVVLGGADQIRITFTSAEVGDGSAVDSTTFMPATDDMPAMGLANQDGKLAVRVQAEGAMDSLTGQVTRTDDEGIRFVAEEGTTFDVRDLVRGTERGNQFKVVELGTNGNDIFEAPVEESILLPRSSIFEGPGGSLELEFNIQGTPTIVEFDRLIVDQSSFGPADSDGVSSVTFTHEFTMEKSQFVSLYSSMTGGVFAYFEISSDTTDSAINGFLYDFDDEFFPLEKGTYTISVTLMLSGQPVGDIEAGFHVRSQPDITTEIYSSVTTEAALNEQGESVSVPLEDIYINAGAGDDDVRGTSGNDFLVGGSGDDTLKASAGDDSYIGGLGDDTIKDRADGDDVVVAYNLATDGSDYVELGVGDDVVNLSATGATQIRLTFTSGEVGNGNAFDANTQTNQDGGLAVRAQAEDSKGGLNAESGIGRFDDEGITFKAATGVTFDVRDLVSGVSRGDQFNAAELGTDGDDQIDESASTVNYYVNAGRGDDTVTTGSGNDFLVGGAGNDSLLGGTGNDSYIAGTGDDTIEDLNGGNDTVVAYNLVSDGEDEINLGTGDDVVNVT